MSAPRVVMVVTALNGLDMTRALLASMPAGCPDHDYAVVVVDDGSTDGTMAYLMGWLGVEDWFHMIRNPARGGYLRAANQGMAAAHKRYPGTMMLLLNNDVALLPGCVTAMVQAMDRHPGAGIVGAKLLYPDGRIQHAGAYLDREYNGRHLGQHVLEAAYEDVEDDTEMDYVTTACALMRPELYGITGGYDDRFAPMYYEDPDLCYRAREAGFQVFYAPRARAVHKETATNFKEYGRQAVADMVAANKAKFISIWGGRK